MIQTYKIRSAQLDVVTAKKPCNYIFGILGHVIKSFSQETANMVNLNT